MEGFRLGPLWIFGCLRLPTPVLGKTDLWNKVFVFPASSATATVHLPVSNHQPLTQLTVCLSYYTLLSRPYALFSYATQSASNDFLIIRFSSTDYYVYIGGAALNFNVPPKEKPSWEHICVSWDSRNGLVQLWLNGEPLPRQGLKKGYSLSGFDFNQSFVGEISNVNMWARVLPPVGIRMLRNNITPPDPLIYWRSLRYTIKNEVYVWGPIVPL
uniref:Pentraxin family member n=1 Tax=Naja naja TaxID=35670 RepID=A0A8C6X990_NAJNA